MIVTDVIKDEFGSEYYITKLETYEELCSTIKNRVKELNSVDPILYCLIKDKIDQALLDCINKDLKEDYERDED